MVKVVPADEAKTQAIYAASGETEGVCLAMTEQGRDRGWLVFRLEGDSGEITALFSEEYPLIELLVRAALHVAQRHGAVTMGATRETVVRVLAPFAFPAVPGGVAVNIDAFFNRPCTGGACAACAEKPAE